jgi:hypothetical protein
MNQHRRALAVLAALTLAAVWACEATGPSASEGSTDSPSNSAAAPGAPADTTGAHGALTPFLPSERCAVCHSGAPTAQALTTATGDDVSPFETWRATPMANAFRDPYWRAQVAREVELAPERRGAIEAQCLTCHAPMNHHATRLGGEPTPTLAEVSESELAHDGVSCTVCHRTTPDGLGEAASFNGALPVGRDGVIYGPYKEPAIGPMRGHTGFTPTHGAHISSSALCGSCHTLYTSSGSGEPFLEQAPYLEWRNSVYSDEQGATSRSKTCQECHMPDVGSMKIARNPRGLDFNIAVRPDVRAHSFVGGNALLIEMLRDNAEELGVKASPAALERILNATRAQLAHSTARVAVQNPRRSADALEFDVRVENLAGHKFPSGYPSRRAWLRTSVRSGRTSLFDSGAFDDRGRLQGVVDESALAHFDRIERPQDVQVYELVAADAAGRATQSLGAMARPLKDNRLLPRGWKRDGPHADETAPVGVDDDDFGDGGDTLTYRVALPPDAGELVITVWLHYQPIPPHWADALRASTTPEAAAFLRMYDSASTAPETAALTIEVVP